MMGTLTHYYYRMPQILTFSLPKVLFVLVRFLYANYNRVNCECLRCKVDHERNIFVMFGLSV